MAVIEQRPYIDEGGKEHQDLVKHYSDGGKQIFQVETGSIYTEAVDKYPCKFTYEEVPELSEDELIQDNRVVDDNYS